MATAPLTNLVVRCYPGEDGKTGTFALYEDDGVTTAYQKGAFALTPLTYSARKGSVTVTVGAATGTYAGQPTTRGITVELPDTQQATGATRDGQPVAITYDAATATNRITLPPRPVGQATTLIVQAAPADTDALRVRAVARRMAGILGQPVAGATVHDLLQAAIAAAPLGDDAAREALLAAAGVGVVHKNEGAYLYRGKIEDTLFTPGGVLSAPPQTTTLPSGQMTATVKIGGQSIDLPNNASSVEMLMGADNVARAAKVTVSGTEDGYKQDGATDGVVDGYPGDSTAEWSSGQTTGATLRLDWTTPQTIDRVLLFDRPNLTDQITAGTVEFSDGTTLPVGALPNDASTPFALKFPAKTITWLKFTVTAVKPETQNSGLAEIAVMRAGAK